jgi:hypothetical protein
VGIDPVSGDLPDWSSEALRQIERGIREHEQVLRHECTRLCETLQDLFGPDLHYVMRRQADGLSESLMVHLPAYIPTPQRRAKR